MKYHQIIIELSDVELKERIANDFGVPENESTYLLAKSSVLRDYGHTISVSEIVREDV